MKLRGNYSEDVTPYSCNNSQSGFILHVITVLITTIYVT